MRADSIIQGRTSTTPFDQYQDITDDFEREAYEGWARQVKELLGGRTPKQFMELDVEAREGLLEAVLVPDHRVICAREGHSHENEGRSCILHQVDILGDDSVAEKLAAEALRIFYGRNTFVVDCSNLSDFFATCDREGGKVSRLIVEVHAIEWPEYYQKTRGQDLVTIAHNLKQLEGRPGLEHLEVHFKDGHLPKAVDVPQVAKDVSGAIEDLKYCFDVRRDYFDAYGSLDKSGRMISSAEAD